MISLTRKADYALVALAHLAQVRRQGEGAISARVIAERFDMPVALLMNILKELAHGKLVRSTRGANGGYELARDPATISLLDVVLGVEGPAPLTACACDRDELPILGQQSCRVAPTCPIREPIRRLHRRLQRFLAEMTLADLMENELENGTDESDDAHGLTHIPLAIAQQL